MCFFNNISYCSVNSSYHFLLITSLSFNVLCLFLRFLVSELMLPLNGSMPTTPTKELGTYIDLDKDSENKQRCCGLFSSE